MPLSAGALAGLYALSYLSDPENFAHTYYHPIASVLWFTLLYATLQVRPGEQVRWHVVLRARWVTAVGLISYSLYIWHEPVMLWLIKSGLVPTSQAGFPFAALIVLAVALGVGTASYWLIEYPASLLGKAKDGKGGARDFYPDPTR